MSRTTCPDCNEELQPIKIIDATSPGPSDKGIAHVELSYSAPDAKPSFFSHAIPREGTIKANLCPKCGRVLLYAWPL
jgi:RNase P subunit RPR2